VIPDPDGQGKDLGLGEPERSEYYMDVVRE
jgi:hypothetical protein